MSSKNHAKNTCPFIGGIRNCGFCCRIKVYSSF
nr:MAG TPA: hypothetical protein [Caudoviricetes sp.]